MFAAVKSAKGGPVEEGDVGAGTGTVVFGWKGGIGTSSRRLPGNLGGYTVGVLVQTNFGGVLTIAGAPVGAGAWPVLFASRNCSSRAWLASKDKADGSCMIVVATDAPMECAQFETAGGACVAGCCAHREFGVKRQRRLRDSVLDRAAGADPCRCECKSMITR